MQYAVFNATAMFGVLLPCHYSYGHRTYDDVTAHRRVNKTVYLKADLNAKLSK